MDAETLAPARTTRPEARRSARDRVIRRVQLITDGRAFDGIMLDISRQGARVQVGEAERMPGEFHLRASDGTVQKVARRWAQGRQMGVEFLGIEAGDDLLPPSRAEPAEIRQALRTAPLQEVISQLVRAGHFGDDTLRTAARDLVAALDRVERALHDLAPPSRGA